MELNDLDGPEFQIAQLAAGGHSTPDIAAELDLTERAAASRLRVIFDKLGVRDRRELRNKVGATEWQRAFGQIRAFIDAHGHSRIPEAYLAEDGTPLAGLVSNIRWRHAGRDWLSERPRPKGSDFFPGVDYEADLDRLSGWTWENETASEISELRSRRFDVPIIRALGLTDGVDEARYIRAITAALRTGHESPWPWLRNRVAERGIDVGRAVLADFIPDHHGICYLVVLVSPDTRVYAFTMLFAGDRNYPEDWAALKLNEWRELSAPEDQEPYAEQIALGIRLLEDQHS
jgi:hypothetical protein